MRRAARAEGFVVGAAVASSAARRPVVVAAPMPMTTVVAAPMAPPQTIVVDNYNPYAQPAYRPPTYPQPGYPQPGYMEPGYGAPPAPGYGPPPAAYAPPPAAYAPPPAAYAPPPAAYVPPPHVVVEPHKVAPVIVPAAAPAVVAVTTPVAPAAVAAAAAVETVAIAAAAERRHFYLINEATCTVLGVDKACLKPGTHLVIDRRRPDKSFHQIWYLDEKGIIRSKLTDFAMESKGRDERVKLTPYVGEARQEWVLEGNRIVNKAVRTNCLGLRKLLRLKDDADVIVQAYEGKPYQHWRMEPVVL